MFVTLHFCGAAPAPGAANKTKVNYNYNQKGEYMMRRKQENTHL